MKKKITKSSGNVFVDLGFDPAEAAVLQMRSNLMNDLRLYIVKHKLTQSQAANRLGIAQSRVSDSFVGNGTNSALKCSSRLRHVSGVRFGLNPQPEAVPRFKRSHFCEYHR